MVDTLRDPVRLVARLGTKLTLKGFPVTPEDTRKALEALSTLPPDSDPAVVGRVLAGIYSRTEQQYEEFLRLWHSLTSPEREVRKEPKMDTLTRDLTDIVSEDVYSRVMRRIEREELKPLSTDTILRWYRVRG